MSDCILKIERIENGYEVEVVDPDIVAANSKPKGCYIDPWKSYALKTAADVTKFVGAHLDTLKPPPDAETQFSSAFSKATEED